MVRQSSAKRFILYSSLFFVIVFSGATSPQSLQDDPMIHVVGGSFLMGDHFGEGHGMESPTHQVTLDDFLVSSHEVTVKQFRTFASETGYRTSAESDWGAETQ